MKLSYNMYGGQTVLKKIPIYGAGTSIVEGAIVMRGATPGTNQGFGIVAASGLAGVLGLLTTKDTNTVAGADSKQDGTAYTKYQVIINPDAVYRADYVAPATAAIAVASTSTTTVTITSLEDDIDGGWLYGSDYQLQYLTASASGSATSKTATGWTSATKVAKIYPQFHKLINLNTAADSLSGAAAAGTGKASVIENYIRDVSIPTQALDPTKHSGVTFTSTTTIMADIIFKDHAFGPTSA